MAVATTARSVVAPAAAPGRRLGGVREEAPGMEDERRRGGRPGGGEGETACGGGERGRLGHGSGRRRRGGHGVPAALHHHGPRGAVSARAAACRHGVLRSQR